MGTETLRETSEQYVRDGFCFGGPFIEPAALDNARAAAEAVLAGSYKAGVAPIYRTWSPGEPPKMLVKIDLPHLCDERLHAIVAEPRIGSWAGAVLDASFVQVWACELICKLPQQDDHLGEPGVIGWHRDDGSWRRWAGEVATVWVALDDVHEDMGAVRYVVGSHRWTLRDESNYFFDDDLDDQRRRISASVAESWIERVATLRAGEVTLHSRRTLHASGPNKGQRPRLGLAVHLRTERSHLVVTDEPPYHSPDLADLYACPVLFDRDARLEESAGHG